MKENKDKLIFSPQLANYLLSKGFTINKLKVKRDTDDEIVFVFTGDPELTKAMEEWSLQENGKEINKNNVEAKVVEKHQLANHLLQCGFELIKLKPHRKDSKRSVFVFRLVDGLLEAMDYWMNH